MRPTSVRRAPGGRGREGRQGGWRQQAHQTLSLRASAPSCGKERLSKAARSVGRLVGNRAGSPSLDLIFQSPWPAASRTREDKAKVVPMFGNLVDA